MMKNIVEQAEKYIRKLGMIRAGDVVIAGVSGGADSICLLFVLCALREKLGFEVKVCHVNHGMRGSRADADEAYVREVCARLRTEARFFHENVELIARKRKQSPEEAGRAVRREAFERMCREEGGTKIATAHHQDDNAETVLMNLSRGTGLKGMCGIWPVRGQWIRPLLCLSRREIENWLRDQGIAWCTDETNDEDDYTRNRIRHHILPLLEEQVNPQAVRHLGELSVQAREVLAYLEAGTDQAWIRCVSRTGRGGLFLSGSALEQEAPAVQKHLVKRCLADVRGSEKDIEYVHIRTALELLEKQNSRRVELPGGISVRKVYGGLEIAAAEAEKSRRHEEVFAERTLDIPGNTRLLEQNLCITCRILEEYDAGAAAEIPQKSYTKWLDYDIIKHGLSVRTRRQGDYLTVDEKGSRQKLKSYFINEKIPGEVREKLPLIADGPEIVWIPGLRLNRAYYVTGGTKKILEIKITEEKENVRDDQSAGSGRES